MSHPIYRTLSIGGVAATTALLGLAASPAASAAPRAMAYTCSGGSWSTGPAMIPSGTYGSLTVTGICMVPDGATVTVENNVVVRPGAVLAAFSSATLHIGGNAIAERGAVLGIGCTAELGCATTADQQVRGNVIGYHPLAVYLNGAVVKRNLLIEGGGPGADCIDNGFPPIGHDLPIKDNTIGGNVIIDGWAGCWAGLIRNTIGGNVIYTNVKANLSLDSNGNPLDPQGPDSNEIVANTIGGFLACWGNDPAPQYGDAGAPPYATNHAARGTWGQCRGL